MSLSPREIPLGAMRFNSDSNRLEYWNGSVWMQIHTFSPNLDGGARGVFHSGRTSSGTEVNTIDFITISTQGDAVDFGDSTQATEANNTSTVSSRTRGLYAGGQSNGDTIDFVNIETTGNATDFGDSVKRAYGGALSDSHGGLGGF